MRATAKPRNAYSLAHSRTVTGSPIPSSPVASRFCPTCNTRERNRLAIIGASGGVEVYNQWAIGRGGDGHVHHARGDSHVTGHGGRLEDARPGGGGPPGAGHLLVRAGEGELREDAQAGQASAAAGRGAPAASDADNPLPGGPGRMRNTLPFPSHTVRRQGVQYNVKANEFVWAWQTSETAAE